MSEPVDRLAAMIADCKRDGSPSFVLAMAEAMVELHRRLDDIEARLIALGTLVAGRVAA